MYKIVFTNNKSIFNTEITVDFRKFTHPNKLKEQDNHPNILRMSNISQLCNLLQAFLQEIGQVIQAFTGKGNVQVSLMPTKA